jgi:hypothetical protein
MFLKIYIGSRRGSSGARTLQWCLQPGGQLRLPRPIFCITLQKQKKKQKKTSSSFTKKQSKKKTQSVDGEQQRQYAALDAGTQAASYIPP